MTITHIQVLVVDKNESPIPGAEIAWSFQSREERKDFGSLRTGDDAKDPVKIEIDGPIDEQRIMLTASFRGVSKTERIDATKRDHTIKLDLALTEQSQVDTSLPVVPSAAAVPPPAPAAAAVPPPAPAAAPVVLPQPMAAAGYIFVMFIGLGMSIFVGWYLLTHPDQLAQNDASNRSFFFLLILWGLSSAAFLFGAMRSTANLRGEKYGTAYEFGGPAAIFIVVVVGGFFITKPTQESVLVVRLKADHAISNLQNSRIVVFFGMREEDKAFSPNGQALIAGIASRSLNGPISIQFHSKVYKLLREGPYQATQDSPGQYYLNLDVERIGNAEAKQDPQFTLERCRTAVHQQNYLVAIERCSEAAKEHPTDFRALQALGTAQYQMGRFAQAANSFRQALDLPNADKATLYYNIAFAESLGGDNLASLRSFDLAERAAGGRQFMLNLIWIGKAGVFKDLWIKKSDEDQNFDKAVKAYNDFLQDGVPKFWALGYLACLYALKSEQERKGAGGEKHRDLAATKLEAAIADLRSFASPELKVKEVEAFAEEFGPDSQTECAKSLAALWASQQAYRQLFARLR